MGSAASARSPARDGAGGRGTHTESEIELRVGELKLQAARNQPQPRSVCVRVEALGMEGGQPFETRALAPPMGSAPLRFGWQHAVALSEGNRAWAALERALEGAGSPPANLNVFFVVVDASNNVELGEVPVDLAPLLAPGARESSAFQQVQVQSKQGGTLGTLGVRIRAQEALRAVQDAQRAPAPSGPPKRVEQLSANDLHAVLTARGLRVPSTVQARTFYLDLCKRERLREVSAAELATAKRGGVEPTQTDARVELGVEEVVITDRSLQHSQPRSMCVRIEALGMEGDGQPLETRATAPARGATPTRFDYRQSLTLTKGSRGWSALERALDRSASGGRVDIVFELLDADSGAALGEASLDISPLTRGEEERSTQQVQLFDRRNLAIGHALVLVRVQDAVRTVQRSGGSSRGSEGTKRVVSVTVPRLHMPGEPISVTVDGQTFDVYAPKGLRAGQTFDAEVNVAESTGGRAASARRSQQRDERRDERDQPGSPGSASGRSRGRWSGGADSAADANTVESRRARQKAYDDQRKAAQPPPPAQTRQRSPSRDQGHQQPSHHSQTPYQQQQLPHQHQPAQFAQSMPSYSQPPQHAAAPSLPSAVAAAFPHGTSPTEVEHALIVAFERLGQAQAQIATHNAQRAKLERELAREREQSSEVNKELRQVKAEREAQRQRLEELGGVRSSTRPLLMEGGVRGSAGALTGGVASGPAALSVTERKHAEQLRKRLGNFQAAKEEEVRALNKKLSQAHDATMVEAQERQKAERQTVDALRRLSEAQAALDQERRHAQAVGTERERLSAALAEAQFQHRELAVVLEAEQQMRYQLEEQYGVPAPLGRMPARGLVRDGTLGSSLGRGGISGRSGLAASVPVRGSAGAVHRAPPSRGASRPASRPASHPPSPGGSKINSPIREKSGAVAEQQASGAPRGRWIGHKERDASSAANRAEDEQPKGDATTTSASERSGERGGERGDGSLAGASGEGAAAAPAVTEPTTAARADVGASRRSFGASNMPPPRVQASPPPSPCTHAVRSSAEQLGTSPLRSSFDASRADRCAPLRPSDSEVDMAVRMRNMAMGIDEALMSGAGKDKSVMPLAQRYKYAVARRDAADAQQQVLGIGETRRSLNSSLGASQ
jgi:hypothetical protein